MWRSAGLHALESILINHGSAKSADALAIVNANFTGGATVRLGRGSTINAADVYETIAAKGRANLWKLFTPTTYRYSKLEIQDSGNPNGFLKIGVLWLGDRTKLPQFVNDFDFENRVIVGHLDTEFGRRHLEHIWHHAMMTLDFQALSAAELATLRDIWQDHSGDYRPVFLIPDRLGLEGYWTRIVSFERRRATRDSITAMFQEMPAGLSLL